MSDIDLELHPPIAIIVTAMPYRSGDGRYLAQIANQRFEGTFIHRHRTN
jgi:hypothetical protein